MDVYISTAPAQPLPHLGCHLFFRISFKTTLVGTVFNVKDTEELKPFMSKLPLL